MSEHITLTHEQIDAILGNAPAFVDGWRLVSSDITDEDWRHGHRELTVVTSDDKNFWAIERRVPIDEVCPEWDCRDQNGPEYQLHRVVPVEVVKTVYRKPGGAA